MHAATSNVPYDRQISAFCSLSSSMERERAVGHKRGKGRPPKNFYKDEDDQIQGFQFPSPFIPKRKRSKTWRLGTKFSLYDNGVEKTHMQLHQDDEPNGPLETSVGGEISASSSNELVKVDVECVGNKGLITCSSSVGKKSCKLDGGCVEREGWSSCSSSSRKKLLQCDDGCSEKEEKSDGVDTLESISCSSSWFEDLDLPCLSHLEVPGPIPSVASMYCDAGLFLDFFDDVPMY